MKHNKAWIDYCIQFHTYQDYFECHEILEEHWKEQTIRTKTDIWVGFIALAVALYHQRIQNYKGAKKLMIQAQHIFLKNSSLLPSFGFTESTFHLFIDEIKVNIENNKPFHPVALPFMEDYLQMLKLEHNLIIHSNMLTDKFLIYKHTLRDRSEVIATRKASLKRKE